MHRNVPTIAEDATIAKLTELMIRFKVHHVPVLRGKELVGIIARRDLIKLIASASLPGV